ncbi:hypothetical protein MLD38_036889 [Melastoma candidum]|uniref:Uncharacterized protein n=1 Tax=Melastoma candidum TaxID=119954 RepID=A0ACB9LLR6_9MYRT|nr:hypothetical protein MLD38_036889 [Melastoma candidum]
MENLHLCLLLILLPLLSFFLLYKHRSECASPNLPPGSIGFPVVGESLSFLCARWAGHPEKFVLDRMSRYSSQVFRTSLLREPIAVLCGRTGNKFLFSNENKLVVTWFPSAVNRIFPSSLQSSATEEGIKVRKMLVQVLKLESLKHYIGDMDRHAQMHFATGWEGKDRVEALPLVDQYMFSTTSKLFIGINDLEHIFKLTDLFHVVFTGIFSILINLPGTSFNRAIKAGKVIKKGLKEIIKQKKINIVNETSSASPSILSQMLQLTDEEGKHMNESEIEDKILGVITGGNYTLIVACTFVIKYLAELPEIYEQFYNEQIQIAKAKAPGEPLNWDDIQKMKYSWNVICEVMRLTPPADGAFREAIHDFTFDGFFIPKGWMLYWSAYSTHRNPEYFPQPEKFDPSRYDGTGPAPYTYVPFGGGPRMCPGKEFARLIILVFLHNLVKRFRWEKLVSDEKIVANPLPKPADGLPIRLYPHKV